MEKLLVLIIIIIINVKNVNVYNCVDDDVDDLIINILLNVIQFNSFVLSILVYLCYSQFNKQVQVIDACSVYLFMKRLIDQLLLFQFYKNKNFFSGKNMLLIHHQHN